MPLMAKRIFLYLQLHLYSVLPEREVGDEILSCCALKSIVAAVEKYIRQFASSIKYSSKVNM